MTPKLFANSLLFSFLINSATAQKIKYYDANSNESGRGNAYYFTVQHRINDTCWEKDYYRMNGPLIKIEQYRDQMNTEKNGQCFYYDKFGIIDSSGFFLNNQQEGSWILYDATGDPSLEEIYHNGEIISAKDVKPNKIKDTIGAKESSFPGGNKGWEQYLSRNLRIPDQIINDNSNFNGQAIVSFVVDKDGAVHTLCLSNPFCIRWMTCI